MSVIESVRDRARGCLVGQIAGDNLGALVEFQSARDIRAAYPEGVRQLADGGCWNLLAGQPTDDSELALALARSIVAAGGFDIEAVATSYGRWFASPPFDIGRTTHTALSAAARARSGKAAAAMAAASTESQANGSLMRVSPIGIWAGTQERAARAAAEDSGLSHPHAACRAACASYAAAVSVGVRGGDVAAMLAAALDLVPSPAIRESLALALGGAPENADSKHQGWVQIAYQNAFHHLARRTPFAQALTETIGLGGDTDTNAAITGALLGAAQGLAAIPPEMVATVVGCRPDAGSRRPRPVEYWPNDALTLADALLAATPSP